jgi:hypothetical protein
MATAKPIQRGMDKPPRYSLPQLLKIRKKVQSLIEADLGLKHQVLRGSSLSDLQEKLEAMVLMGMDSDTTDLKGYGSHEFYMDIEDLVKNQKDAVRSLLGLYQGQTLTSSTVKNIGIHVAGWLQELKRGIEFTPWDGAGPCWALLYISDVQKLPVRGRMYKVTVESYAGQSTGSLWNLVLPGGYLQNLIRQAGCRKFDHYEDEDVSGLWFTSRLIYHKGALKMTAVQTTASQQKHNKKLQMARTLPCPGVFPAKAGKKCGLCPMSRGQCGRARLKEPATPRECANGHVGYFRNDDDKYCLSCVKVGKYKGRR